MLNTGDLQNIYKTYFYLFFLFRQCHTPDEGDLDFHSIYTYSSCTFECKLKVYYNSLTSTVGIDKFYIRKQRSRQGVFLGISHRIQHQAQ